MLNVCTDDAAAMGPVERHATAPLCANKSSAREFVSTRACVRQEWPKTNLNVGRTDRAGGDPVHNDTNNSPYQPRAVGECDGLCVAWQTRKLGSCLEGV